MVVTHLDMMAQIKAVLPLSLVLSGELPQERREETVSSDANRAADISGVLPSLVSGCNETVMMIHIVIMVEDCSNLLLIEDIVKIVIIEEERLPKDIDLPEVVSRFSLLL